MSRSRHALAVLALLPALAGLTLVTSASPAAAVTRLSDSAAAAQLSAAGVTRSSSGGCTDRTRSTCTSYEQINDSTVQGVITYRRASGCAVNITGGTETGHASGTYSHANGYKVDVARSACNDAWITGTYTYVGLRGDGYPIYRAASGNDYVDEGSHWDITYYTCGC